MKIVTWNCHYGLTEEKARKVSDFGKADIYFIQEVMENDGARYPAIEECLGRQWSWYSDHDEYEKECERTGRGNSKDNHDLGIAIFSNKYRVTRSNEGLEQYRYVVPYDVCDGDGKKLFTAFHVWTKASTHLSKATYAGIATEAMAYYAKKMDGLPFIVLGDFNYGSNVQLLPGLENIGDASKPTYKCIEKGNKDYGKTYHNDSCFVSNGWAKKEAAGIRAESLFFYEGTSTNDKERSDHHPVMAELTLA